VAVHLTRIYTRTGDDGTTGLSDFSRVPKTHPRLDAYADSEEANAAIGVALALGDLSLLVKVGVQFGLTGGAIHRLGTQRHHEYYLPKIASVELAGCFAMTEVGHGSDVRSLGTTATYDPDTDEIVVHTPTPAARSRSAASATRVTRWFAPVTRAAW